jgi:hypothetical protein
MTETELRIADLELRIGDIDLALQVYADDGEYSHEIDADMLIDRRARLTEELRCLKQSLPQQQSE